MKYIIILIFSLFSMISCNDNSNKSNKENQDSTVGGVKDKHGCLTATGQTWSSLKQDCIRIFEEGKRLESIPLNESETSLSAFILFNDDQSQCELFLPNNKENSQILSKIEDSLYSGDQYLYNVKESVLYIDGKIKYQAKK